ncbi:MAG: helix-turn-helix domain-containing protein [Actinobacteria bacterium]|nr:helix-turn-helix domain-containing protein [Actinomycetota bacterium]
MIDAEYGRAIGSRLQAVRQERRLSLEDLEQRSPGGFTVDVLARWESGERVPSWPRLAQLARFYGVPLRVLLPPENR